MSLWASPSFLSRVIPFVIIIRVTITGFGTFSQITRKARTGRNPQTGEVRTYHRTRSASDVVSSASAHFMYVSCAAAALPAQPLEIAEQRAPKFKPSPKFKRRLN